MKQFLLRLLEALFGGEVEYPFDEYDQCIECSKCLDHEPGCGRA